MSSRKRLSNLYFRFTSGVSSGAPASIHSFQPLRINGPFNRYGPYTRRWKVNPFRHMRGLCAKVPRLP
jgi:hypothetical protein